MWLEELDLTGLPLITDDGMEAVAMRGMVLKKLRVDHCHKVTAVGLQHLLSPLEVRRDASDNQQHSKTEFCDWFCDKYGQELGKEKWEGAAATETEETVGTIEQVSVCGTAITDAGMLLITTCNGLKGQETLALVLEECPNVIQVGATAFVNIRKDVRISFSTKDINHCHWMGNEYVTMS